MKKLIGLLLALLMLFCFAACNGTDATDNSGVEDSQEAVSRAIRKPPLGPGPAFDLGVGVSDIIDGLFEKGYWNELNSFEFDEYNVSYTTAFEYESLLIYCYGEPDSEFISNVLITAPSADNKNAREVRTAAKKAMKQALDGMEVETIEIEFETETKVVFGFYAADTSLDYTELPYRIADLRTNDYFSDPERQQFYRSCTVAHQYNPIYESVNEYLANNDVETYDSAYAILTVLEEIIPIPDNFVSSYDEFSDKYTISFTGADVIGSNCSFAPTVSGNEVKAKFGFTKSGWLFFDKYEIQADGERVKGGSFKSYDIERDVLSGSTIREYVLSTISVKEREEFLQAIANAQNVIIRFTNSDNKETYDHTFTASEKAAARTANSMILVRSELLDIVNEFNR